VRAATGERRPAELRKSRSLASLGTTIQLSSRQERAAATEGPAFLSRTTRSGFTLLELLVVLTLFAITAAAVVPAFLGDTLSTPEQRTATALASVLAQTRDAARTSGAPATLVVSPSDGRYWITTRDSTGAGVIALPGTIRLAGPNAERFECRFSPSGPATPLVVTVHGTRDVAVRVDGWSGNIGIGDGRAS
jgi:prepilin-type N-terminal cleavage/methylation domain-containing protein